MRRHLLCELEAAAAPAIVNPRGLRPANTFERAAGELWPSRFEANCDIVVVNNGHRKFVFASKHRALQLRYLLRQYVKERGLTNFACLPAKQLLERMLELTLYTDDKLKPGLLGCCTSQLSTDVAEKDTDLVGAPICHEPQNHNVCDKDLRSPSGQML